MTEPFKFTEDERRKFFMGYLVPFRNGEYSSQHIFDRIESIIQSREDVDGGEVETIESAEAVLKQVLREIYPNDRSDNIGVVVLTEHVITAMHRHAANCVRGKDEHIKNLMDNFDYETGKLESELTSLRAALSEKDARVNELEKQIELPNGYKKYQCTDCKNIDVLKNNGEITVGFCTNCGHPLWND